MRSNPNQPRKKPRKWTASKRVPGSGPFTIMVLVTLSGLAACSWILSAFLSVLSLASYSQQHIDQWQEISRLINFVITHTENDTINEMSAKATQNRIATILERENLLKQKLDQEITGSRLSRQLLITTQKEEEAIATADISPLIRQRLQKIKTVPASFLQAEFSYWNTATSVEIRSGRLVLPLTQRKKILAASEQRGVIILWALLGFISASILTVLLSLWYTSAKPAIARLQRTEAELRDQRKELQMILNNVPGFVYSFSTELKCLSANKACIRALGLQSEKEIIGKSLRKLIGSRNWKKIKTHALHAINGQTVSYDVATVILGVEGTLHAKYVPELDAAGNVSRVFALVVDIHEREVAQQALRDSEENLRITLDSIGDAVIATDCDGTIVRMNPIACKLTGWTVKDAIGQPLENVFHIVRGDNREMAGYPVNQVLQSGEVTDLSDEIILISKTGEEYEIADSGGPIMDNQGRTIGVVLVFRDVTQENTLNKKLRQNDKMQAIGQLAGGIAHDFNNILAGIMGSIELLEVLERGKLQAKSAELVESIIRTTERASDLTSKLTAFARVSDVRFQVADITETLDDTIALISKTSDRRIRIRRENAAHSLVVRGSLSNLQSAFLNICLNAIQAMPDGGDLSIKTKNVILDERACENHSFDLSKGIFLKVSISDTGCGIPRAHLDNIFEPFFTTKDVNSGTGLGLSAVYGTIQDHSGAITVTSQLGKGSVFEILLPCSPDIPQRDAPLVQISKNKNLDGMVLLVDDEANIRSLGKLAIESLGHSVILAENGQVAVELYTHHGTDISLVVLDMNMPVLNGKETFIELKRINPECKIIIATGFIENDDISFVAEHGAAEILQKPFRVSDYARIINDASDAQ